MASALERALSDLANAIRGGLQVTTRSARANDIYVPFRVTLDSASAVDAWVPKTGHRYVLRGGVVTAMVSTVLAAADEGTLELIDEDTGDCRCPLGSYAAAGVAASVITGAFAHPFQFDLKDGAVGSAVDSKLQVIASEDITTGEILVSGILWGTEVAG